MKYSRLSRALVVGALLLLAAALPACAQGLLAYQLGGRVYASQFDKWSIRVDTPVLAPGSATITVNPGYLALPGGPSFQPIAAHTPLYISDGSESETVTPSSVTCSQTSIGTSCSVTATFANAHSGSFYLMSGSDGLQEAINYAATNRGGGLVVVDPSFDGTTSTITGAYGATSVEVVDERNGVLDVYGAPAAGSGYQLVTSISGITATSHGLLQGACTGVSTASATLGLYGLGTYAATTCTGTATNEGWVAPEAGTLRNLTVSATAAGTSASSGVVTVLKNGSATALTCTVGTATSCSDTTHSATYAAGDIISIEFTTQAAETLAGVKASVNY